MRQLHHCQLPEQHSVLPVQQEQGRGPYGCARPLGRRTLTRNAIVGCRCRVPGSVAPVTWPLTQVACAATGPSGAARVLGRGVLWDRPTMARVQEI
jgi:hypothetical protein